MMLLSPIFLLDFNTINMQKESREIDYFSLKIPIIINQSLFLHSHFLFPKPSPFLPQFRCHSFAIYILFSIILMNRNPEKPVTTKEAIQNMIKYSQNHSNLLQKYNTDFFVSYFDSYTIEELEEKIGRSKKMNKKWFVWELVSFILHKPEDTLFLVMGLLEIFDRIGAQLKCESEISIKDFTWYLCQTISSNQSQDTVNTKEIPIDRIHPNPKKVRDIDLHPPVIVSHPQKEIPKISKNIKKKEKKVDSVKPLHTFYYNYERKQIITLGRLASHITIFNLKFHQTGKIEPACFKLYDKNMAIMSLAFSERQQRIGCIISNLGMAFWDYEDNFQTEKFIKKIIGDRIYYLQLLDQWITTDENKIYFWDLKDEKVKAQYGQSRAININDIKEITHLRCLAVSYTLNDNFKWLYIYENNGMKVGSRLKLSHVGAQKIHYNKCTQTLLLLGMNYLPVYSIDKVSLDVSLLKSLEGHDTIITSIADLDEGLIITGDDRGTMKIWDLKTLRCQQVIKVANTINKIQCIGSTLLYSDSRINIMKIQQLTQQIPLSQMYGLKKFYRLQNPIYEVYIFTTVSCRIYDLTNGRIKEVIEVCIDEEQIITVQKLQSDFLISTTKGYLLSYTDNMKFKWKMNTSKYHEDEIHYMKSDAKNKFVTTVSKEGNMQVWNEKVFLEEGPRKVMQNTMKDYHFQITCFDLSERFSMMVTGEKQPNVKIWDYESCKLCHIIELESASCSIKVSNSFPLITIACINEKIYLYHFQRNQNVFDVKFAHLVNLRYPENTINSILSIRTFSDIKPHLRQELKTLYCNNIILYHHKQHSMVLSYGKGSIIAFNITGLILSLFREKPNIKFTLNLQRPIRQTLEKQLNKNQFRRTPIVNQVQMNDDFLPVHWNKILHRDTITDIDNFQQQYLSSLSLDGYFKITTIENCEVICSLCIRYPLPTLWKLQIFKYDEIGRKLYESLKIISQILNDKQMPHDESEADFKTVSNLMKEICNHKGEKDVKVKDKMVPVLKDELAPLDLRQAKTNESQQSLKYLQAYRRVNLIKQIRQVKSQGLESDYPKKIYSSVEERQHLQKFLSPNYFPNLYARQENAELKERYESLYARSMNASLSNSREKLFGTKDKIALSGLQKSELHTKRKAGEQSKKLPMRSLSQNIKFCSDKYSLPEKERCKKVNKDIQGQLKTNLPLKSLSVFMKNLNEKIPKENQIRKHLRKFSDFNSKF